jgi:hypothetical protein
MRELESECTKLKNAMMILNWDAGVRRRKGRGRGRGRASRRCQKDLRIKNDLWLTKKRDQETRIGLSSKQARQTLRQTWLRVLLQLAEGDTNELARELE